jgi:hypothetical protein
MHAQFIRERLLREAELAASALQCGRRHGDIVANDYKVVKVVNDPRAAPMSGAARERWWRVARTGSVYGERGHLPCGAWR